MPKEKLETVPDASPEANAESTPKNFKTIAIVFGAAVCVGLLCGVCGALALRKAESPPPAAVPSVAKPAAADAAPALAPALASAPTAPAQGSAPRPAAGPAPIPVLTGAEIKERYNITRFVDIETDSLCYLAEPRASTMNGSLTCEPRPSHVSNQRGQ
jgi:hypothetical protein